MKIKCDYCGGFIEDTEEKCPNCGAVNEHLMRSADGIPKTIEELQAFCKAKNLPLEQMRFLSALTTSTRKRSVYSRTATGISSYTKTRATAAVLCVTAERTRLTP